MHPFKFLFPLSLVLHRHFYFLQTTFIEHTHLELPLSTTRNTSKGKEAAEMKQEQVRFFFCLVKITPSNFSCRHGLLRRLPGEERKRNLFQFICASEAREKNISETNVNRRRQDLFFICSTFIRGMAALRNGNGSLAAIWDEMRNWENIDQSCILAFD